MISEYFEHPVSVLGPYSPKHAISTRSLQVHPTSPQHRNAPSFRSSSSSAPVIRTWVVLSTLQLMASSVLSSRHPHISSSSALRSKSARERRREEKRRRRRRKAREGIPSNSE
ncbi:hypothetical protein PMAYCL1PPCAC_31145, partial [Pristionchus mayeri]